MAAIYPNTHSEDVVFHLLLLLLLLHFSPTTEGLSSIWKRSFASLPPDPSAQTKKKKNRHTRLSSLLTTCPERTASESELKGQKNKTKKKNNKMDAASVNTAGPWPTKNNNRSTVPFSIWRRPFSERGAHLYLLHVTQHAFQGQGPQPGIGLLL